MKNKSTIEGKSTVYMEILNRYNFEINFLYTEVISVAYAPEVVDTKIQNTRQIKCLGAITGIRIAIVYTL